MKTKIKFDCSEVLEEIGQNIYSYKNTPFCIADPEGNEKWVITIGNEIVSSKEFQTKEEAVLYLRKKPWDIILTAAVIITQKIIDKEAKEEIIEQKQEKQ